MTVAQRIYQIMEQKCMKQCLVARAAGYEPKVFNEMLRGRRLIRIDDLNPICTALGVTPNELFNGVGQEVG